LLLLQSARKRNRIIDVMFLNHVPAGDVHVRFLLALNFDAFGNDFLIRFSMPFDGGFFDGNLNFMDSLCVLAITCRDIVIFGGKRRQ
jgi:hypothetical protein